MTIFDVQISSLTGRPSDLGQYRGNAVLVVNVASQCGLAPQYAGLQALAEAYGHRGLVILGVPCNQFGGQEPGTSEQIKTFCETGYGVTFPMTEKIDVNGVGRHALYTLLVDTPDATGHTGDIRWNFEKFLVAPDGQVTDRFAPQVIPETPELVSAIERVLPH